jgi:hypothetical protein
MRTFLISASMTALMASTAWANVGVELTYEGGGFNTVLKVVEPEGATCTINGTNKQTTPFAFNAQPHMYYAMSCLLPNGQVWQKKIEAKQGKIGIVKLKAGAAAVAPVKVTTVKVAPAGPTAMTGSAFGGLLNSVKSASFSSDKINVVKAAAGGNHFTIAQVGQLMDACSHSSDKVKIAQILRNRVVDKQNAFQLGNHLSFSSDKEKVMRLFQ